MNPQLSEAELGEIYGPDYGLIENDPVREAMVLHSKRATAEHYLDLLAPYIAKPQPGDQHAPRLLEIGCGSGDFLLRAGLRGFVVTGVEYSAHACARARAQLAGRGRVVQGEIGVLAAEHDAYDVCGLSDVIEHVRDPGAFLGEVFRLLKPGGVLLVATPSLDSWSARLLRAHWMEFKAEHLYYYSRATITRQLTRTGFELVSVKPGTKRLSLDYVTAHCEKYPVPVVTPALRFLRMITPAPLSGRLFSVVASGLIALARKPGAGRGQVKSNPN